MFKLEFDPSNRPLAAAMGRALLEYGEALAPHPARRDAPPAAAVSQLNDGDLPHIDENGATLEEFAETGNTAIDVLRAESHTTGPVDEVGALDPVVLDTGPDLDIRVDNNNVLFDKAFCANAAKPFYASGKREGQWKKRGGVGEPEYDKWYDVEYAKAAPDTTTTATEDAPINTAGAFSGTATATAADTAPKDCGQYMTWISELMVAERVSQIQINAAYEAVGVSMADIVPPTAPEAVATNVGKLYNYLVAVAAAQ